MSRNGKGSPSGNYEVGRGKPPASGRIKPGEVKNPYGRAGKPDGPAQRRKEKQAVRAYQDPTRRALFEEANRMITVTEDGRKKRIRKIDALVRSLLNDAVRGNRTAQKLFLSLLNSYEGDRKAEHEGALAAVFEYQAAWEKEKQRQAESGKKGRQPQIDPANIHVDPETEKITVFEPLKGPAKKRYLEGEKIKKGLDEEIARFEADLARTPDDKHLQDGLRQAREHRRLADKAYPPARPLR